MTIRDLANGEVAFLQEMLYTALAWRPDVQLPPKEWVLEQQQVECDASATFRKLLATLRSGQV